jgi:hypothetical protein
VQGPELKLQYLKKKKKKRKVKTIAGGKIIKPSIQVRQFCLPLSKTKLVNSELLLFKSLKKQKWDTKGT